MCHVHISENKHGISGGSHAAEASIFKVLQDGGYNNWLTIEAFGLKVPELSPASPCVDISWMTLECGPPSHPGDLGEVEEPQIGVSADLHSMSLLLMMMNVRTQIASGTKCNYRAGPLS
jgi:hypothetical protein